MQSWSIIFWKRLELRVKVRESVIFMSSTKGASAEEKKEFFLEDCDKYPKLCEGGSSVIGHGHGPEYVVCSLIVSHSLAQRTHSCVTNTTTLPCIPHSQLYQSSVFTFF